MLISGTYLDSQRDFTAWFKYQVEERNPVERKDYSELTTKNVQYSGIKRGDYSMTIDTDSTSWIVASLFSKRHIHVLRDIDKLLDNEELSRANFGLTSNLDDRGREQPITEMTKNGFI